MRVLYFICILIITAFLGCNQNRPDMNVQDAVLKDIEGSVNHENIAGGLLPADYIHWVDNNLVREKTFGDVIYELKYTPVAYKLIKKGDYPDTESLEKDIENNSDSQFFTFVIKTKNENISPLKYNLNSEQEYYARVEYLSFGITNDIYLVDSKDTLPCQINYFERNYNLAPYITESLTFENNSNDGDKLFIYEDRLFGNGILKFRITKEEISDIPKIIF